MINLKSFFNEMGADVGITEKIRENLRFMTPFYLRKLRRETYDLIYEIDTYLYLKEKSIGTK
jgi:hypothetical protein